MNTQEKQVLIAKYNLLYSQKSKNAQTLLSFCYNQSKKDKDKALAIFRRLLKYYDKDTLINLMGRRVPKKTLRKLHKKQLISMMIDSSKETIL